MNLNQHQVSEDSIQSLKKFEEKVKGEIIQ